MRHQTSLDVTTSIGICLSAYFSSQCFAFSYVAIPALLLPSDAPLMPPLVLEPGAKSDFDTDQAPKHLLDSGIGDKKESIFDSGATEAVLRTQKPGTGSPSSTSYLLRQWFHIFSKGMHSLAWTAVAAGGCYGVSSCYCLGSVQGSMALGGPLAIKRWLFLLAMVLNVGVMVFTQTALKPTNDALHELVAQVVAQEKESRGSLDVDDKRAETEKLIRKWGKINAVRGLLPVAGIVTAIIAMAL